MINHERQEIALAVGLAGLAGYVDAIGYLRLDGFYVSFMSGNSTQAGVSFASGAFHPFGLLVGLIGAFVVGVMAGTVVGRLAGVHRRWAVLAFVTAVLTVAGALALIPGAAILAPPVMAFAMGAENGVFERGGEVSIGLTYMTGTLVKMGQHLTRALFGDPDSAWHRYLALWAGLAGGGVLGATSYLSLGLTSLWIAVALAAAATVLTKTLRI